MQEARPDGIFAVPARGISGRRQRELFRFGRHRPRDGAARAPYRRAIRRPILLGLSRGVAVMSTRQQAAIERVIAEVEVLREWAAWVRGDPRLTAWEEGFATSIHRGLDEPERRFLSQKQKAIVWKIGAKTGFRGVPPDDAPRLDEDFPESEDDDWG